MRQRRYFWAVLLSALVMLLGISVLPASAAQIKIYDEGNRLSSSELAECEARLQQASDLTGMHIGVVIGVQSRSDLTIETLADSTYDELFGHKSDGLLYYMDLKGSSPYDYISTSGMGQMYYTNASDNNRVDDMFSAMDPYLYPIGGEDVYGAVMEFANQVEYYYKAGVPDRYYVYDDRYHEYYYVENGKLMTSSTKPYRDWFMVPAMAVFFGGIGAIAALITFFAVKSHYKFKYALSPTTYVNQKNVNYRQQYDNFVRTSTSRRYIDTSSSSGRSGGHSGGGHSSGGHGGGGHHR